MTRRFGTDGIRGRANTEPMTAATALRVALAVALRLRRGRHRHTAVIGKDTRLSGYMIEPALTAGFTAMGMDVILVGPLPTPGIAMLTRSLRADLGVMISASHNPHQDNGIKLFGPDGYKLSDAIEGDIERLMDADLSTELAAPEDLGRARRLGDGCGRYVEFAKATFPRGLSLGGLRVAVDCAHGAAYKAAPAVLYELGADVVAICDRPNGTNINDRCGATSPEALARKVVAAGCDIGIALDGDADRVILVDETGQTIDGDQLLALIARNWVREGTLRGDGVVSTVMSNLGLERYLETLGLALARTPVGDRYVVERMRLAGYNLGGEPSGHVVLSDYATTGDGLVAALQVLTVLVQAGRPASEICRIFEPVPQGLRSVRCGGGSPLGDEEVRAAIDRARLRLGAEGRLLVRPSGTEPVIRIMVEAEDEALIEDILSEVSQAIEGRSPAMAS